jgi:hypothetical protein
MTSLKNLLKIIYLKPTLAKVKRSNLRFTKLEKKLQTLVSRFLIARYACNTNRCLTSAKKVASNIKTQIRYGAQGSQRLLKVIWWSQTYSPKPVTQRTNLNPSAINFRLLGTDPCETSSNLFKSHANSLTCCCPTIVSKKSLLKNLEHL